MRNGTAAPGKPKSTYYNDNIISGATVNASLIVSGLDEPRGIAISGGDLLAANMGSAIVGEYVTSEATVNGSLIPGLFGPTAIAVGPESPFLLIATVAPFRLLIAISGPTEPVVVQASTNLLNWVDVYTNTPPFTYTDTTVTVFPDRFYRAMSSSNSSGE